MSPFLLLRITPFGPHEQIAKSAHIVGYRKQHALISTRIALAGDEGKALETLAMFHSVRPGQPGQHMQR